MKTQIDYSYRFFLPHINSSTTGLGLSLLASMTLVYYSSRVLGAGGVPYPARQARCDRGRLGGLYEFCGSVC